MDAGTLELIELDDILAMEAPCTATAHDSGQWGHEQGQGAAWRLTYPCGHSANWCDAGVKNLLWQTEIHHTRCDVHVPIEEIDVRPI